MRFKRRVLSILAALTVCVSVFGFDAQPTGAATVNVSLSEDTFIVENAPSTPQGSGTTLNLAYAGAKGATNRKPYIKFTIPSNLTPTQVTSAYIKLMISATNLNQTSGGKGPSDETLVLYEAPTGWSESTLTWNNAPSRGIEVTRMTLSKDSGVGSWISIDVADYIKSKSAGATVAFSMELTASAALSFYSKENGTSGNNPYVQINTNETLTPPTVTALSALGGMLRLESRNEAGYYIRSTSSGVAVAKNVSPLNDARFNEVTGFISGTGYVALESVSRPGYYLRKVANTYTFTLATNNGSTDFKNNATFKKVQGLGDSSGVSYQLYTDPTKFLKIIGTGLTAGTADNTTEKNKATFYVRQQKTAYMADEFDGSSLNTNIWAYNYPWGTSHNYSAVARSTQVSVSGGKLILTATRVADDNWIQNHNGDVGYWDSIGDATWRKFSHLTGVVHLPFSRYPLNQKCYIEGSFKMPSRSGFWPAFWLNGNYSWPPEIDIFEYLSNTPEKIYVGIHKYNSSYANNDEGHGWWITKTASFFQNSFHNYAIDWGSTYINYYIDGELVRSVEDQSIIDNQQNMYMIINLGVGGWATEPTDSVGDQTTLECEYVRIYKY